MDHNASLALGLIAVLLGTPLIIGIAGWVRSRGDAQPAKLQWRLTWLSLLTYTLAFNLTFFIQELFLVVPKALTPGLRPTLYHNNHDWSGDNLLAELFQGTGALAILLSGLFFAWLAKRGAGRTEAKRLFILWMAYHGLFQSLPQWAFAPLSPGSDTGRALDYFKLAYDTELLLGALAAAAMVAAGLFMTRRFLELGPADQSPLQRGHLALRLATMPAILAIPILIAFRVPREWNEVIIPTIAVPLAGLTWVQGTAWLVANAAPKPVEQSRSLMTPAILLVALLAIFQLVLRPGIDFF